MKRDAAAANKISSEEAYTWNHPELTFEALQTLFCVMDGHTVVVYGNKTLSVSVKEENQVTM